MSAFVKKSSSERFNAGAEGGCRQVHMWTPPLAVSPLSRRSTHHLCNVHVQHIQTFTLDLVCETRSRPCATVSMTVIYALAMLVKKYKFLATACIDWRFYTLCNRPVPRHQMAYSILKFDRTRPIWGNTNRALWNIRRMPQSKLGRYSTFQYPDHDAYQYAYPEDFSADTLFRVSVSVKRICLILPYVTQYLHKIAIFHMEISLSGSGNRTMHKLNRN